MSEGLFFPQQVAGGVTGAINSSDYVQDSFPDYTLPPTSNTGLSSTISTNPTGDYFGNDLSAKYSTKTLYVKDLVLEEDRSKWVNGGKTYRVIFTENFPGLNAFVVGNVSIAKDLNGTSINIPAPSVNGVADSYFGITGKLVKASFLVKPQATTVTSIVRVDQSSGTVVTCGGFSDETGTVSGANLIDAQSKFFLADDGGALQTNNLHTFTIAPGGAAVAAMQVVGVVVLLAPEQESVSLSPGSLFINKEFTNIPAGASYALPAQNASLLHLGAKTTFFETSLGILGATTFQVPLLQTQATGLSGTNVVSVLAGTAASFPQFSVVNIQVGTSFYLGSVQNVAGDILTLSPTLPFGVSGSTLTKAFRRIPTVGDPRLGSIDSSVYELAYSWDPVRTYGASNWNGASAMFVANGISIPLGFSSIPYLPYYDPENRYFVTPITRSSGFSLSQGRIIASSGTVGWVGPLGIRGDFQAIEFEMAGLVDFSSALFQVDGITLPGISIGLENVGATLSHAFKVALVDGLGIGQHSARYEYSNFGNADPVITKINFYKYKGVSIAGQVYSLEQNQTAYDLPDSRATPVGAFEYFGADKLTYSGAWFKQYQTAAASLTPFPAYARAIAGATTNAVMTFKYYGKNFVLFADGGAGGSYTVTLDGGAILPTSGSIFAVPTESIHTLVVSRATGTFGIQGVAIMKGYRELKSLQSHGPLSEEVNGHNLVNDSVSIYKARKRTKSTFPTIGNVMLSANFATMGANGATPVVFSLGTIKSSGNPILFGANTNFAGVTSTAGLYPSINISSPAAGQTIGQYAMLYVMRYPFGQSNMVVPDADTVTPGLPGSVARLQYGSRIGTTAGFVFPQSFSYPSAFTVVDFAPPGTWSYYLGIVAGASTNVSIYNTAFFAMEMF